VGPYHTGKSFLLNQVARSLPDAAAADATTAGAAAQGEAGGAEEEVFVIGRGVDPETSGPSIIHRRCLAACLSLLRLA